jgi:hypothetical protein
LDVDFCGPFPEESIRNYRYALVIICPKSSYVSIVPIRYKTEVKASLEKIVNLYRQKFSADLGDKVVFGVRCDNEPVIGASTEYKELLQRLQLSELHSTPYHPQGNGVVERFMRTMTSALRAMLLMADHRLWCYALEYFAAIWNRVPRKRLGDSPHKVVERYFEERRSNRQIHGETPLGSSSSPGDSEESPDNDTEQVENGNVDPDSEEDFEYRAEGLPPFKRFGCVAYVKIQPKIETKTTAGSVKGVFLGLDPASSNFLVGCFRAGALTEVRSLDVAFVEDVMVSKIEDLHLEGLEASSGSGIVVLFIRSGVWSVRL